MSMFESHGYCPVCKKKVPLLETGNCIYCFNHVIDGIILTIPYALPTLNAIRGMHHQEYKRLREKLAWEIRAQYQHKGDPIKLCLIFVERYGSGKTPDWVNLYGCFKPLEDCLVRHHSKTHPNGLGIIYDDSPDYVKDLKVIPMKAKRGQEKTVVTIVEI